MDAVYQLNGRRLLGGVVVSCLFGLEFVAAGLVNNAAAAVEYDNPATRTQVTLNPGGSAVTLKNVADGAVNATSTDAVNGRQLSDVHEGVVFAMETLRDAVVDVAKGAATLGEAHDMDVRYTVQALGAGAQVDPVSGALVAPAYRTTAIDASGGAGSEPVISNTVGDAISTLNSSLSNTAAAGVKYDDPAARTQVTLNRGGAAVTLANVADGAVNATSSDAVNGRQLYEAHQGVVFVAESVRDNVIEVAKGVATLADGHDSNTRYMLQALGGDATVDPVTNALVAPGYSTTGVDAAGNVGVEPVVSKSVGGAISALNSSLNNTAAAGVKYDDPAARTHVTLNRGGTAVALANVAEGAVSAASREAVNGSQLFSSEQQTRSAIAQTKRHADQRIDTLDGRVEAAKSATSGLSVAGTGEARAAGEHSVAVGAAARSSAKNAVAVGSKATATADNSVALGANTVADRADSVSVGRLGGERQITHVASGSRATDAVNVSQLDRRVASATQDAYAYTDRRHEQLRRELKHQDNTLSAGIAGAMAMASLPRSSVAGGSMTSMAMGSYRGESAVALGVSYVSPSGRWASNLMGTTNTRNDTGIAVGMGYQW